MCIPGVACVCYKMCKVMFLLNESSDFDIFTMQIAVFTSVLWCVENRTLGLRGMVCAEIVSSFTEYVNSCAKLLSIDMDTLLSPDDDDR